MLARLDAAVRAQPVAALVAGVAVAALLYGARRAQEEAKAPDPSTLTGTRYEALTRWEDEGGPPAPAPVDLEKEEEWLTEARGLRDRAVAMLAQVDQAARRGLAPAVDLARHRAEIVAAMARDTTAALGKGLEALTGVARQQALEARERIYVSRIAMAEKSRQAVISHPLITGAAAAAAGAVVACAFPPTETEDSLMGETRDQLLDELTTALRTEVARTSSFMRTLGAALRDDLSRVSSVVR